MMPEEQRRSLDKVDWSPERKIVAVAVAGILLWLVHLIFAVEVPVEIPVFLSIVLGYFIPNKKS